MDDLKYKNKYLKYKKKYIKLSLEIENQLGGLYTGSAIWTPGHYILFFDSEDATKLPISILNNLSQMGYYQPTDISNYDFKYHLNSSTINLNDHLDKIANFLKDQLWYWKSGSDSIKQYTADRSKIIQSFSNDTTTKFYKNCTLDVYNDLHVIYYDKKDAPKSNIDVDQNDRLVIGNKDSKNKVRISFNPNTDYTNYQLVYDFMIKYMKKVKENDDKMNNKIKKCNLAASKILGVEVKCVNMDGNDIKDDTKSKYWIGLHLNITLGVKSNTIEHIIIYCPKDKTIDDFKKFISGTSQSYTPIGKLQSTREEPLNSSSQLISLKRKSKSGATTASKDNKCEQSDLKLITYVLKPSDNRSIIENIITQIDREAIITYYKNNLNISICKQNVERLKDKLKIT